METNDINEMRKALELFIQLADDGVIQPRSVGEADEHCFCVLEKMARTALAKPARNCDVRTSEDQGERFKNFCRNHQFISVDSEDGFPPMYICSNESCPLHGYYIAHGEDNCELAWGQMPYEEGDNDGSK